jgi:hypothetical protein
MATKAKTAAPAVAAPAVATPAISQAAMLAMIQQMMATQGATPTAKPATKAAAVKPADDPQALIDQALETAGIKVVRFGTQPAKLSKTKKTVGRWVDAKVGGVRFQGNLIIAVK